jgi:hypothetical protein
MPRLTITVPAKVFALDKKAMRANLKQAGNQIVARVRTDLNNTGSGKKYGKHQASAAGSPPSSDTGQLAKKVKAKVGRGGDTIVISEPYYAKFLEFGAEGGGGKQTGIAASGKQLRQRNKRGKPQTTRVLAARPFLYPAAEKEMDSIKDKLVKAFEQGISFKDVK